MKLLVVEDDTRIADIVRRTLTESGYAVDVAFTIPTAIEAIEIETYDLVVLDLMLPEAARGGRSHPQAKAPVRGSFRLPGEAVTVTPCRWHTMRGMIQQPSLGFTAASSLAG